MLSAGGLAEDEFHNRGNRKFKASKNAVILAHYYVPAPVQEIADYIGDSYYLSKMARQTDADVIVFAGVAFMGESAKT